jgi:hypothetical protein
MNSSTDGLFYMSVNDFIDHFDRVEVAHVIPSFQQLFVDVQNDTGVSQAFNFTVNTPGKTYVGVEYYSPRMYPDFCHNYTVGVMTLLSSSGTIISMTFTSDFELFNYFEFEYLQAGSYILLIQNFYDDKDVRDFTARSYSAAGNTLTQLSSA